MSLRIPALCLASIAAACVAAAAPPGNTLIVPGKSIGDFHLDPMSKSEEALDRKAMDQLGEPDASDSAMGGKGAETYYLGAHRGDKGRPFHRPGEIGFDTLRDMEHDSEAHPGHVATVEIYTTSPRFHTAGGIAPGSTLEAIRAKFPDIQPDSAYYGGNGGAVVTTRWPMFGEMDFYIDKKQGIAFSIRKSDGVCVEIEVFPSGTGGTYHYSPLEAYDYMIDPTEGSLGGDIKLGMTASKLVALLGEPDEKRDTGASPGGSIWRWRIPSQGQGEPPGLCIFLWKLPDGSLIASQIRVTSPLFMDTGKIYPGCPLKDALEAAAYMAKLDTHKDEKVDIYGALPAGILIEGRKSDSVCTAITIISSPVDVPWNLGPPKPKMTPKPAQ